MTYKVGLLVGRARTFPEALMAQVAGRRPDVEIGHAQIDATLHDQPLGYDVIVDLVSHDVPCYQPVLKQAVLFGTRVINDPFRRIAYDKFFNVALARRMGVHVPRTVLLPSRAYVEDVSTESLTNLVYPLDWNRIADELGFPMYLKPHWGGGWRDVRRVNSLPELLAAYNNTGRQTMIAQEGLAWEQYVRCIVIGRDEVLPGLWDPARRTTLESYSHGAQIMPPLSESLREQVVTESRRLCQALDCDINTVEWAIRDGAPYAINFMNLAPDFELPALGESNFRWVVEKMADLVIALAEDPSRISHHHWHDMLR